MQLVNAPHVVVQVPALQTCPAAHALPHAPQLATSTLVSLHVPLQLVRPPHENSQLPPLQTWPPVHEVPHVPQLSLS